MSQRGGAGRGVVLAAAAAGGAVLVGLVFFRPEWRGGAPALVPRFDLGAFARELPAQARWLVPFAAITAALPALRALVWRAALAPARVRWPDAYHATALGALVHNAVPGKLGPAAAAALLARFTGRPFGAALSSQLVAKLLELAAVVALGAVAAAARGGGAGRAALAGAAAVAALASAAVALARLGPGAARRLSPRHARWAGLVAAGAEGIRGLAAPARLSRALALGALPPLAAAAAYALPLAAFGVADPLAGGAVILALVTFGQLTPGLPVGTGVYYALAALGARRLGADPADAAALAVLTHAATVLTLLAVGAASAAVRRDALREVLRRARAARRGAGPGGDPGGEPAAGRRSRAPT
ncbi:conserved hypothetical protein [Anaeromyxobacter dehalogenans 2CP-1]|uniref:Flippase-like domain-containing protein n=1 Tax=Anaeromyxobacter dehalogenans (strain ATCC BAA-258 / DSM 21875 / 2CP-1) TaxID=455488 RepID=B8J5I3_ANAD2|nr:lysylphosphatidylglycerol synthase domain-containing protein [Anaeromyxobacter dehalogenans]ACL66845.1 conserved hypothetical protein [Anaeromyxobacter dehalogenans 2CP-1]